MGPTGRRVSTPVVPPRRPVRDDRPSPMAWGLIAPIRFYQRFITPYTPATCRYYPTCSAYAVTALRRRGAAVGTLLTMWRLLRCNPWSDGGLDYVPDHGWPRRGGEPRPVRDGMATNPAVADPNPAGSGHPVDCRKSDTTELARPETDGSQTIGRPAA